MSKVEEWNAYYPCSSEKVRIKVKLSNPSLVIGDWSALYHDFYYFTDEFSLIFDPLPNDELLLEGTHPDPTYGVRVPILSTWCHLKKIWDERGHQRAFAFYNNLWWTIDENIVFYFNDEAYIDLYPVLREQRAAGATLTAIARYLNDRGYTTRLGGKWTHLMVKTTLQRADRLAKV